MRHVVSREEFLDAVIQVLETPILILASSNGVDSKQLFFVPSSGSWHLVVKRKGGDSWSTVFDRDKADDARLAYNDVS
jgi:hypothetical protein